MAEGDPITLEHVSKAFERLFTGEDIQDVIGVGSDYDEKRTVSLNPFALSLNIV